MAIKYPRRVVSLAGFFCAVVFASRAQTVAKEGAKPQASQEKLQQAVNEAVRVTLAKFADKKFQTNELAVTLVDLRDPQQPIQADYRGDVQIYPASVVKLFY